MKKRQRLAGIIIALLFSGVAGAAENTSTSLIGSSICQSQVLVPARFQSTTEKVVTYEASLDFTTTTSQLGYGEKKIKVADAYVEYEIIPATFKEITEEVEVERERVEIESFPATYRTDTKHLKVRDASVRWNPACPSVSGGANIPPNCLLETPAEYQDINREVVEMPARTVKKNIPGKTITVTRKVLVEPAKVVRKEIPAVYETIQLSRVEQPVKTSSTPRPEQSRNVAIQRKIQPERFISMPALCENSLQGNEVSRIQQALQQQGYYTGATHGKLDIATRTALTRFQQDKQLASGAITLESLQKLGLR